MYELLSRRIKNSSGEPEVYIYDMCPKEFRNQVFYIIEDLVEPYNNYDFDMWDFLEEIFCREKGLKTMGRKNSIKANRYGKSNIEYYFEVANNEAFLDAVDMFFNFFDKKLRNIGPEYNNGTNSNQQVNKAITELNYRFKQHNLGYELLDGQIVRIDSKILHKEVVKPTLKLLYEQGFEGAEEEMREAYENRRKGDNKNAILYAGKAFESTIKTICSKKGYPYDAARDTAQKLINVLENNDFYPKYMTTHLTNLRATLETGLPVVRNKNAGHGQGATVVNVPDELVDYALHLASTNILFLMKIYTQTK